MTTPEIVLIAMVATLWVLGGYITNQGLIVSGNQTRPHLITMVLWPILVLYVMLSA